MQGFFKLLYSYRRHLTENPQTSQTSHRHFAEPSPRHHAYTFQRPNSELSLETLHRVLAETGNAGSSVRDLTAYSLPSAPQTPHLPRSLHMDFSQGSVPLHRPSHRNPAQRHLNRALTKLSHPTKSSHGDLTQKLPGDSSELTWKLCT